MPSNGNPLSIAGRINLCSCKSSPDLWLSTQGNAKRSDIGNWHTLPGLANGPYGVNGFFSCALNGETYPEFVPFLQPWYNGTTFDETCNAGFPFTDIFDTPPKDPAGYTHGEILWNGRPRATPYIYDTMEASYYFEEEENEEGNGGGETSGSTGGSNAGAGTTGIGLLIGLAITGLTFNG